ncbi:MAG: hypothetical protein ABI274_07850 [Ktedonobacterales bacterium]
MATYDTNYTDTNGEQGESAPRRAQQHGAQPDEQLTEELASDGQRETLNMPDMPRDQTGQPSEESSALAGDVTPTPLHARERRTARAAKSGEASQRAKRAARKESAPITEIDEIAEPVSITLARNENIAQVSEQAGGLDADETALLELEAQGFTEDEALRLISISGRLASSREARESQATLRRLRFTRWLIDRGILDEFSA